MDTLIVKLRFKKENLEMKQRALKKSTMETTPPLISKLIN